MGSENDLNPGDEIREDCWSNAEPYRDWMAGAGDDGEARRDTGWRRARIDDVKPRT